MIKAEALTRTYGGVKAVNGVSFEIGPREIVGLLGHNGAGKTTIMKMITGYLEPSAGSITLNGVNAYADRLKIQQSIGYLPENCPLYPEMTVLSYLDYAAGLRGVSEENKVARVSYAVEKTKLASVIEKPISTLSRGYKQRLGVAQAILNSPSVLILDEPTNGLDPSQILEMRSLIRELSETATIVISTHILQEVQALCGRVIIINEGELALDSQLKTLQSASKLLVAVDREPEDCEQVFAQCPHLELKGHEKKGNQYWYTLQGQTEQIEETTPQLVKRLVDGGCKIYLVKPVMRDLETIFGEITAGKAKVKQSIAGEQTTAEEATDAVPALVNSSETTQVSSNEEDNGDAS